ncbi:MAG: glucosiduronase, partial [Acidobacteriaceae bacterium]|nr:glucosiduronase [Acidobacteriaceae bacterium]
FDYRVDGASTLMKDVVSGRAFHRPLGGMVGVSDVGLDSNWMGYDLAQANLYGFGRLAWNPDLSARQITEEWTRMTWGNDDRVVSTIMNLELESWHVYEGYTGPLGVGTLTDILRSHYGPGIESAERNGWGQWIRADHEGIGMDRTVATGTGYIGQYSPEIARRYESLATCPDDLLLFMHHVPYTHVLDSGETVIQYVYDSHYDAAAEAEEFPEWWKTLRGRVDEQRFEAVLRKLEYQAGHAMEWRDAICQWFERISGIPDKGGRVGHDAGRTEAEGMLLNGYQIVDVTPWETASAGKAISCPASSCSAELTFKGAPGWYHIGVQYFDVSTGTARFELFVNSQLVKRWTANASLPFKAVNGDTSTRETVDGVALRSGDKIRLVGYPDGGNAAAVDYIEIRPE